MSGLLVKSHAHHAREPRGDERPRAWPRRPVLLGGAALTRTYVERRPARGLRGPAVLRQGRVRGSPHDGPAHGRRKQHAAPSTPTSGVRPAGASCRPRKSEQEAARRRSRSAAALGRRHRRARLHPARSSAPRVAKGIPLDDIAGVRQRDRAVPQPVAVPARQDDGETDDRVQGPDPPDAARRSSTTAKSEGWLVPAVVWGYFPVNADGDDLDRLDRRRPPHRAAAVPLPPPAQGPLPLHRRLLPPRRVRRRRLRRASTS